MLLIIRHYLASRRSALRQTLRNLKAAPMVTLLLARGRRELYKLFFKDIQVMLLTVGFSNSGSSLIGFLLTAHPNIVMADEPKIIYKNGTIDGDIDCIYAADLNKIFNTIFNVDYKRWRMAKYRGHPKNDPPSDIRISSYTLVPDQYQGRFKSATVVGIKKSVSNRIVLSRKGMLQDFKRRLEERAISLKFIFTIRNPYDMISLRAVKSLTRKNQNLEFLQKKIDRSVFVIGRMAEKNMEFLNQVDPKDVFVYKNEDMITDPSLQLTKLCNFLQVPVPSDYLDSCASCVFKEPHRRRFEFDWTIEQKQKVAAMIEKYDFFSGYDWES